MVVAPDGTAPRRSDRSLRADAIADDGAVTAGEPTLRRAGPADAEAIAAVHVDGWQWGYRGQLPDEVLENLGSTLAVRPAFWRGETAREEIAVWVMELAGTVVGFASFGPARDADVEPGTGELYLIYLARAAAGRGLGRALHEHVLDELRRRGHRRAVLWTLETNARARRFYEIAGWRPEGARKRESRPGYELREVRYQLAL
jgi:GNAT superfamily N-acetyltransferase